MFQPFSGPHLVILFVVFGLALLFLCFPTLIKRPSVTTSIRVTLILMLIVQQFLLYSWYAMNHEWNVSDALPLYPCRLTTLFVLIMLITRRTFLLNFTFYWGIIGALLALLSPDTNELGFPNAMFIQFFVGHSALLLGILFIVITTGFKVTKEGLLLTYKQSLVYFALMFIINTIFGSNYAYLRTLPPSPFLTWAPSYPWHIPLIISAIFLLFYVVYSLCRKRLA